jgi:MFS transporter, DHA1 family, tetracycline resistance protein
MKSMIRSFTKTMSSSFQLVQGNARACLLTQPLWSVTANLFNPYLTLYLLAVGCTSDQVGLVNAIGMIVGTVVAVFAGWITDRLGRRLANALGDLVCWALACLIWGLSQNVIWFIAAACASSFGRISGVAWNCSLSEDIAPEHRVNIFWWLNVVATLTAFVTPLMNLLIVPFGLVPAMRGVLLGSSGLLVIAIYIRYRMMKELPVGRERREAARRESPLAALKAYIPMLKLIFSNPLLLVYILLRTLYYVQIGLKGTFQPITVVQGLGFSNTIIGTLNLITGAVMLLAQFLLLSRLRTLSADKAMAVSLTTMTASMLILVFSPAHSMALLILSTMLSAAGTVVTGMLVDTSLANALPDSERAQLLSLATVLTVAFSAPLMWLGGVLSGLPKLGPRLPMAMIAILFAVCLVLLWIAGRIKKGTIEIPRRTANFSN